MSYIQDDTLVSMIFIKDTDEEISLHIDNKEVYEIDISIPSFIKVGAIERKLKHILNTIDSKVFNKNITLRLYTRHVDKVDVDISKNNEVAKIIYSYNALDKDKCLAQLSIFDGYNICCVVKEKSNG